MRINTNVNSISARNALTRHTATTETSMERLTTGKRINTAADDAAGLSISTRMRSDILGARQGIRNANDAVSFLQTAEGSLETVEEMLQRSRELLVQYANDTNVQFDRSAIQQEVDHLTAGIQQLTEQTRFNGEPVFGDESTLQGKDAIEYALQTYWLPEAEYLIEEHFGLTGKGKPIELNYENDPASTYAASVSSRDYNAATDEFDRFILNINLAAFPDVSLPDGGKTDWVLDRTIAHEMVHAVMRANMGMVPATPNEVPGWFTEGTAQLIEGGDDDVARILRNPAHTAATLMTHLKTTPGSPAPPSDVAAGYASAYVAGRMLHDAAGGEESGGIKRLMSLMSDGQTLDQAIAATTPFASKAAFEAYMQGPDGESYINSMSLYDRDTGAIHGSDYGFRSKDSKGTLVNRAYRTDEDNMRLTGARNMTRELGTHIQMSGAVGDQLALDRIFVDEGAIGLRGLRLSDTEQAFEQIDLALDIVGSKRSLLGAMQNRLDFALNSLDVFAEQTSAARSRIKDADYALETAELSRSKVTSQAAQTMLAQANTQPQDVLQLLQF
ncbi:MAG: flagellinolysin [Marinobacterium sp.]|nr:flagellinolysin [Marinobacterium sp.]